MQNHALGFRQDTLRAMCLLRNAPEFRLFMEALKAQREQVRDAIEAYDDPIAQNTLRGRSQELGEILSIIEQSHDLLGKLMAKGKG